MQSYIIIKTWLKVGYSSQALLHPKNPKTFKTFIIFKSHCINFFSISSWLIILTFLDVSHFTLLQFHENRIFMVFFALFCFRLMFFCYYKSYRIFCLKMQKLKNKNKQNFKFVSSSVRKIKFVFILFILTFWWFHICCCWPIHGLNKF